MTPRPRPVAVVLVLCALAGCAVAFARSGQAPSGVVHDEYVAKAGRLYVYDVDKRAALVGSSALPGVHAIRGIGASAATAMLYISYRAASDGSGNLLAYSLYHAISGRVVGTIAAGRSPHDTGVGVTGQHVFLGGASGRYLHEADAARPWAVLRRIGPLEPAGVAGIRPFTINAQDTLAFTTGDRYLGFQVSDIATGRLLYTVPVPGFAMSPSNAELTASHGIGLSPDQRSLWLVDGPDRAVHEFDISGLPRTAPRLVATVRLPGRPGWLNLSRDGRYLFVGDVGTEIDTRTDRAVGTIGALTGSRYNFEADWSGQRVCAAYPRESLGYAGTAAPCHAGAR